MTFELHSPLVAPIAVAPLSRVSVAIVDETPADRAAREELLDAAFGPARFLKTCERLREGAEPASGLALVAKDDEGELLATIRLWPIFAGGRRPALLLGPLAVAEHARSLGLGAEMIRASLARAQALGHRAVLLVGDEPYYRRFGFKQRFTEKLVLPGPVERPRFLGIELAPGALEGASGMVRAAPLVTPAALPRAA